MLRFSFICACFALAGQTALATPPDIVDVRDSFLGLSEQNIFVLRSTRDNLGVYDSERRDVTLVLTDRATGDETLLPVYSTRSWANEPMQDNPQLIQSTAAELPDRAVNPFSVLHQQSGTAYALDEAETGEVARQGDTLEVQFGSDPAMSLSETDLLAQASANLDRLAAHIGDYQRLAPVTLADLIGGQNLASAECSVGQAARLDDFRGKPPVVLLRFDCDSEGQILSMLLPVVP